MLFAISIRQADGRRLYRDRDRCRDVHFGSNLWADHQYRDRRGRIRRPGHSTEGFGDEETFSVMMLPFER